MIPKFHALLLALLLLSGCATQRTLETARGGVQHQDAKTGQVVTEDAKPVAYAFVPIALVFDIVTSPIQLPVWIWFGLIEHSLDEGAHM